jgi:hypothetical protein
VDEAEDGEERKRGWETDKDKEENRDDVFVIMLIHSCELQWHSLHVT